MFERYLKKPTTTSVGFLVLEKLNSSSSRQQRVSKGLHDRTSAKSVSRKRQSPVIQPRPTALGGGVISDPQGTPHRRSKKEMKDNDSFAVSIMQTTFEIEQPSVQLREKKFDTLSTEQASIEGKHARSQFKFANSQHSSLGRAKETAFPIRKS